MDVLPTLINDEDAYGIYITLVLGAANIVAHVVVIEVADERSEECRCRKVVARMEGIEFRKIKIPSLRRSLAAFAGHSNPDHAGSGRPTIIASAIPATAHFQTSTIQSPAASNYRKSLVRPAYTSRSSSHLSTTSTAFTLSNPEPAFDTRAEVVQIISQTCDIPLVDLDSDLDVELCNYGIDSLMSIEILSALRERFPSVQRLASSRLASLMTECRTIEEIIAAIEKIQCPEVSATSFIPLLLGDESFSTTATLFDDDGCTAVATNAYPRSGPDSPVSVLGASIDIETQVKSVLSSVLEVPLNEIGEDVVMGALGLDSLTSIELQSILWDTLGIHTEYRSSKDWASCALSERCLTVRELVIFVERQVQEVSRVGLKEKEGEGQPYRFQEEGDEDVAVDTEETQGALGQLLQLEENPLLIQSSSTLPLPSGPASLPSSDLPVSVASGHGRIPVVFVHDGSGLVSYLRRLPLIGRDLWGIQNPKFFGVGCGSDGHVEQASDRIKDDSWESVEEMAKEYTQYVLEASMRSSVDEGVILAGAWRFA